MKKILVIVCFLYTAGYGTVNAASNPVTVMILGDSLSTSYGMPLQAGWVNLLQQRLQTYSTSYQVVNISISGETTLGGRNRIEQALQTHHPDIVMVGLGGNDGLQGSSIKSIYENLATIIKSCQQSGAAVLLLGMQIPPNYGISYTEKFRDIYPRLAEKFQVDLVPFLLAGFGEKRQFFQSDGIHPNRQAQEMILDNVWTVLFPMLQPELVATTKTETE